MSYWPLYAVTFFLPPPPHYHQCAPPLQAPPPPLSSICPLLFSTDSVWEEPISICWQFMAAFKIKHDTVENGSQSQSFKSPVRLWAFCKTKKQNRLLASFALVYLISFLRGSQRNVRCGEKVKTRRQKSREDSSRRSCKHWIKAFLKG